MNALVILSIILLFHPSISALLVSTPADPLIIRGNGRVHSSLVRNLTFYTRYMSIAYCSLDQINAFDCIDCKEQELAGTHSAIAFNESLTGTQGYAAINDLHKFIILSVRGRANSINTHATLKFTYTSPFPLSTWARDAKVHGGFYHAFTGIKSKIQNAILTLAHKRSEYDVVFSGHSMGGAMSTMAALEAMRPDGGYLISLRKPSQIRIYTVGQPRVGNAAYANLINSIGFKHVYRAVNYIDPVPHLPSRYLGFRHHLREIYLDQKGQALYCNDVLHHGEDTNCANLIKPGDYNASYHRTYFGIEVGRGSRC